MVYLVSAVDGRKVVAEKNRAACVEKQKLQVINRRLREYKYQFVYGHNKKDSTPTLLWMKNKFCVLLQFGILNDDTYKTL